MGRSEVIRRCADLIDGADGEPDFIATIGGAPATRLLVDGRPQGQAYWVRVWALRGLLWASPGDSAAVIRRALADDHWRVREMACKVVARHRVDDVLDAIEGLRSDSVVRVRRAAERAVRRVVDSA